MCITKIEYKEMTDSMHELSMTLQSVKITGENTLKQAIKTNSRVDKLEERADKGDIFRASRFLNCPNRVDIDMLVKENIKTKAVRREQRLMYGGLALLIISEYVYQLIFG